MSLRLQKSIGYDPTNMDDKMFENVKISEHVVSFITRAMENWRIELAAGEQTQEEVKTQRSFFREDSLSPLLFVIALMPLNYIWRKCKDD